MAFKVPKGSEITFRGKSAFYEADELREMRTFPDTEEGRMFAELVHDLKVALDATLLPSDPELKSSAALRA